MFATGNFEHVTLFDLLVTLTQGTKTGKIDIRIDQDPAVIIVTEGVITTALYQSCIGEEAILQIFTAVDGNPNCEFVIRKLNPSHTPAPTSIVPTSMDQLLFKIATSLDQQRQNLIPT